MRIFCGNRRIAKRIIEDIASHIQNEKEKEKKNTNTIQQSLSFGIKMPIQLNEIHCCYTHFYYLFPWQRHRIDPIYQYREASKQKNE